jgi:hypothetical protein
VASGALSDGKDAILGLPKTRQDDEEMHTEEGDGMEPEGGAGPMGFHRISQL